MRLNNCFLQALTDFLCLSKGYLWHHPHSQAPSILLFFTLFLPLKDFQYQAYSGLSFMPLHKTISELRCSALLTETQVLSEFSCVHLTNYLRSYPYYYYYCCCWSSLPPFSGNLLVFLHSWADWRHCEYKYVTLLRHIMTLSYLSKEFAIILSQCRMAGSTDLIIQRFKPSTSNFSRR